MKKSLVSIPLILLACVACATIARETRMLQFNDTLDAYRLALLSGEFQNAAQFIDPLVQTDNIDYEQYKNIEVVEYKIITAKIDDDIQRIEQDVELQYYLLNRNILKTNQTQQIWQYQTDTKHWMLKTGLPVFEP